MSLMERDASLELARRVVAASPADETEVTVQSTVERFARFADDGPTQSADRERADVAVRVRLRGEGGVREARSTCDGTDEALVRGALERALALARVAPPDPELEPLGGAVEVPERRADGATLEHSFSDKAAWIGAALEACGAEGLVPAGLAQTTGVARALANSSGRGVYGATARAAFSLTASAPDLVGGAGFAEQIAARVAELDPSRVVRRAVEKAVAGRSPEAAPAGEYTVVLEPAAVSALLLFASYKGFGAQEVHERASFLCGREGQKVFPDGLTVLDDAGNEVYAGLPFDGEGTPKQRVVLVDSGVITGPVTDSRWARRLGKANTGHALPMPNVEGPKALNPVIAAGDASLEELIAGVERGLLVTQFHYTNLIDPRELVLTGMTRNGTYRIEQGRLAGAVKNLRFTESLVGALSRVTGIGREREVAGALFDGEVVCPALRIEGFRFTSTTDF